MKAHDAGRPLVPDCVLMRTRHDSSRPWPLGIELKLQAYELLLSQHPEMAEKMVLVQVCNPARSAGRDIQELQAEVGSIVERLNATYGYTEGTGDMTKARDGGC